jgi:DNA-binding LacI/PurR family transcriptional regulator
MEKASRKKRVTAQDIADLAGVSRSAVSRAFTEGGYIEPGKRARVLKAADDLGYRPNAMAAGLQGARSNLVAIFAGEMANEYDKEVTTALVTGLNRIGKWPIVIAGSGQTARDAVTKVLSYPLEAMILRSGSLNADIAGSCSKLGIPVISSGRIQDLPGVDNVCCRNRDGMALGTQLLFDKGRRRFGYIGGPPGFASSRDRRLGVMDTLAAADLTPVAEVVGGFTVQSGHDAVAATPALAGADALICANDAMAIGAMTALKERCIRVPDDISVIGFDDISMARWPAFDPTTLRNPIDGLVDAVLDLLTTRESDPDRPERTVHLDATLILRSTH